MESTPLFKNLKPTPDGSIPLELITAASNKLGRVLRCPDEGILAGEIPRIATRKYPSLDNYLADLLLRSCYPKSKRVPHYGEFVVDDVGGELSAERNPWITGAILIGVGGNSQPDGALRVYDEHIPGGGRRSESASRIVFEEHMGSLTASPAKQALKAVVDEVSAIDSGGGAGYDHLGSVLKGLHRARFGPERRPLGAQEKRALVGALICGVCAAPTADQQTPSAGDPFRKSWQIWLHKRKASGQPAAARKVAGWVESKILSRASSHHALRVRKLYDQAMRIWNRELVQAIMSRLFESLLQLQESFVRTWQVSVQRQALASKFELFYYEKLPGDLLPHRALLAKSNSQRRRAFVAIRDPEPNSLTIMANNFIPAAIWEGFVAMLQEAEGDGVWYVPIHAKTGLARFALNRTESYCGSTPSRLTVKDLVRLLTAAVKAGGER